eukprot:g5804.t1
MTWDCLPQLLKEGGQKLLDDKYSDYSPSVEGTTVTISADGKSLPEGGDADKVCLTMASLKRHLFGAPLTSAFEKLKSGSSGNASWFDYRLDGRLYVKPMSDRVVVSHAIHFEDETDAALVYVFLQEFMDAQKKSHVAAPHCQFHKSPPDEVAGMIKDNNIEMPPASVTTYYLTFAVQPTHIDSSGKLHKCVELLIDVRNYMNYHIKCTKAFLHTRMRNKVDELHKVLKACYPQNVKGQKKGKKKAGGGSAKKKHKRRI